MNFPFRGYFDDYCDTIDIFIGLEMTRKRELGFLLHDHNSNDMKIDLGDIQESIRSMNSLDLSIDDLRARNNHSENELKSLG